MALKAGDKVVVRCGAGRSLREGRVISTADREHHHGKKISLTDKLSVVLGRYIEEEENERYSFSFEKDTMGKNLILSLASGDVYVAELSPAVNKQRKYRKRRKR